MLALSLFAFFLISAASTALVASETMMLIDDDFDPLVDLEVTVDIHTIRSLEKRDRQTHTFETIDWISDPDFYLKIFIDDEEFTSDIWHDQGYHYDLHWKAILDVSDYEEFVPVKIELWDWNNNGDKLCDLSATEAYAVELLYSVKNGHWSGDDTLNDPSGYGRVNGCDDGSIYQHDRDCELWFSIYQNDFDGDGIPYWTEVYEYGTDPEVDNTGEDADNDNIPLEWEWKWQYDPFTWNDHSTLDPEVDGIDNYEEYLTCQWYSDPFRKDLFVELDQMEESPEGVQCLLPEGSKELLQTAFDRQNVVYHLDDGSWEETGSEMVPFDEATDDDELYNIYRNYFLHGGSTWRRGIFHYGVVIYQSTKVNGHCFGPNRFQISANGMEQKARSIVLNRDEVYASAYMHETGHTFDFRPIGGHNQWSCYPWQIGWWIWRPYKSCMNYGYMFFTVDYSDGSRRINDFDDWTRMDMTYFQRE
jgi:hypothetical protein